MTLRSCPRQFKAQEPGTDAEIKEFAASKGATFPLFSKIDVNGPTAHPLFQWLQTGLVPVCFLSKSLAGELCV